MRPDQMLSTTRQIGHVVTRTARQHVAPSTASAAIDGLQDGVAGVDNAREVALNHGTQAAVLVAVTTTGAAVAGAGNLAGFAGLAAAVADLGLGSVTAGIASAAGLTTAGGAAATSAVVAAVGGPAVATVLLVGTVAGAAYGAYRAVHWLGQQLQQG
jgi:hypothetical protein